MGNFHLRCLFGATLLLRFHILGFVDDFLCNIGRFFIILFHIVLINRILINVFLILF